MDALAVNQIVSGSGMVLVGVLAVAVWWRISRAQFRWFAVGIGLWVVGVAIKVVIAVLTNQTLVSFFREQFPHWLYVTLWGLYVGVESSLCEIGLTLLLVLIWRAPGRHAGTATAVGTGAGAFEAILLGVAAAAAGIVFAYVDHPQVVEAREAAAKVHDSTPLIWLIGPAERILAIVCHMSSRTLVLLGVTKRRVWLVFWGFLLFTYIDSVAGVAHIAGLVGTISMWWIELAIVPAAVASIFIIHWCWRRWGVSEEARAMEFQESEPFYEEGDNV